MNQVMAFTVTVFFRFYRSVILVGSNSSGGDLYGPHRQESCLSNWRENSHEGKGHRPQGYIPKADDRVKHKEGLLEYTRPSMSFR